MTENSNQTKVDFEEITSDTCSLPLESAIRQLFFSLEMAMTLKASSRTARYFIGNNKDSDNSFHSRLERVCATIEKMRSTRSAFIEVDGEIYAKSEYKVPDRIKDYINSGYFWMTIGMKKKDLGIKIGEATSVESVSPAMFNAFFDGYNESQKEDFKITVNPYKQVEYTYSNFSYSYDGPNDRMLKIHDDGTFGIEACELAQIPHEFANTSSFEAFQTSSTERLGLWVLNWVSES